MPWRWCAFGKSNQSEDRCTHLILSWLVRILRGTLFPQTSQKGSGGRPALLRPHLQSVSISLQRMD